MLGKLVKYDLKWTYKVLMVFYALTITFALIGRGFSLIDDSTIFGFLTHFSYGISVAMMFSILINNAMRLWARFIQSIYKDESYLTHTLPVKKRDIYFSKIITTVITIFTSFLVIVLGLFICYYSNDLITFIKSIIPNAFFSVIFEFIAVLFLELLFIQFLGYLAIIIGYRSNDGKLVKSLACGFGLYMLSSGISLVILLIVAVFNKDIMNLFITNSQNIAPSLMQGILALAGVIYVVYIVICNLISNKILNLGVNVD